MFRSSHLSILKICRFRDVEIGHEIKCNPVIYGNRQKDCNRVSCQIQRVNEDLIKEKYKNNEGCRKVETDEIKFGKCKYSRVYRTIEA